MSCSSGRPHPLLRVSTAMNMAMNTHTQAPEAAHHADASQPLSASASDRLSSCTPGHRRIAAAIDWRPSLLRPNSSRTCSRREKQQQQQQWRWRGRRHVMHITSDILSDADQRSDVQHLHVNMNACSLKA